jgi:hypothetical protein
VTEADARPPGGPSRRRPLATPSVPGRRASGRSRHAGPRDTAARQAAAPGGKDLAWTLIDLIRRDLQRGHRHLAARHLLMIGSLRIALPPDLNERCAELLRHYPQARLAQAGRQVDAWRALCLNPPTAAPPSSRAAPTAGARPS